MSDIVVEKKIFVEEGDVETQVFEWGRLFWLAEPRVTEARKFSAGVVYLNPGLAHDRHNHPGVEEILYVVEGMGKQTVECDNGIIAREICPGMLIHIPPDLFHSTANTGDKPMRILAIYAPPGPEVELRAMEGVTIEPPAKECR